MSVRDDVLKIVEDTLMGPNPLDSFKQENGEEILFFSSPLNTYSTGVLFPQIKTGLGIEDVAPAEDESDSEETEPIEIVPSGEVSHGSGSKYYTESVIEAETSKINSYKQSAMGITVCVPKSTKSIKVVIDNLGKYTSKKMSYPVEKKDEEGNRKIIMSEKQKECFLRQKINSELIITADQLPNETNRHIDDYTLKDESGNTIKGLGLTVTYRMETDESFIYTITLVNANKAKDLYADIELYWFQANFSVNIEEDFCALPDTFCVDINDDDYQLNALLYRNVKVFGIGHGCAATWDDAKAPHEIFATVMPEYDVKPIVPGNSIAELSMKVYSEDKEATVKDLTVLCNDYENWIKETKEKADKLESKYYETAQKQLKLAEQCLNRMKKGLELLSADDDILTAFQFANRAMLMQQLHYKLPYTEYSEYDKKTLSLKLKNEIVMPDYNDESTWYNPKGETVYGKWRPFQIAFLLINLESMSNPESDERSIVDLIWFPTGGGKTEAYLGLTAFTILFRRLKDKTNGGTTVLMRYTLRLLTSQQFARASSLICSLEIIRKDNPELFGEERITIGLWVGDSLTDNNSETVRKRINSIRKGDSKDNTSIVLKCPWCGASMETFNTGSTNQTPGYKISDDKKHILFCCENPDCDFHEDEYSLPLVLFDDEIYANPPTLLFGTVDKFATLPFRPQAKTIFGGDGINTPPELIIQDELHLITGPLGSTVGLYETVIDELCSQGGNKPKIIASTATISHAKQQCNALYNCGEDRVFQFPVQGISYDDCFFSKEDSSKAGRKYVGYYGNSSSSSARASIFAFAAFVYAAKAVSVESEDQRDPYWTDLSYFGSMRELGQAATWYIADIKETLEDIYTSRLSASDKENRRYIYENGLSELTSRMSNTEIPQILKKLEIKNTEKYPLDMCLATNMVSVGVDVPRLGLMTVTGQPKSFSEYIQATSRVGRDSKAPGLVFVIYNTSKPRDKSHYERFQSQHAALYKNVEATSVTPFSRPLRERALHALIVTLHRFFVEAENRNNAKRYPTPEEFEEYCSIVLNRAAAIDPEELDDIQKQLDNYLSDWRAWTPSKYEPNPFNPDEEAPLLRSAGSIPNKAWGNRGWDTPMSMRNVDRECQLDCSKRLIIAEDD